MNKEDRLHEEIPIEEFAADFEGRSRDRSDELAKKFPWVVKTDEEMAEIEKRWMKMI
ncbi:MAG: hypothetical protein WCR01_10610 [Bacteroidota bacterium]